MTRPYRLGLDTNDRDSTLFGVGLYTRGSSAVRTAEKRGWHAVGVLAVANALAVMDRFLLGLLQVPIKEQFHLSDTQLGILQGPGFILAYCILAIPGGWLADISSKRKVIASGLVTWSVATAGTAIATSFGTLFLARAIMGTGEATLIPAAIALISTYFSARKLARASAVLNVGSFLGSIAAFFGCGWLLAILTRRGGVMVPGLGHLAPWQGVFVLVSIPGLILAVLVLRLYEPGRHAAKSRHTRLLTEALQYVRLNRKAFICFLFGAVAAAVLIASTSAWAVSLLVRQNSLSAADAGIRFGMVMFLAGPIGSFIIGWVTDRLSARGLKNSPVIVLAGCLALSVFPTVLLGLSGSVSTSLIAFGLLQFLAGMPVYVGLQLLIPRQYMSTVSSLFLVLMVLFGTGTGPLLVGVFADYVFNGPSNLRFALVTTLLLAEILGVIGALLGRGDFAITSLAADQISQEAHQSTHETLCMLNEHAVDKR